MFQSRHLSLSGEKMSKQTKLPKISEAELEILRILWEKDGATIAETQGSLNKSVRQATVQTQLNRLIDKGVVRRNADRPARYWATLGPEEVTARPLQSLVRNVGGGSVFPLIAHLVEGREFTLEEIAALQTLVNNLRLKGETP
jgi:BlaI family penicillinase repressor